MAIKKQTFVKGITVVLFAQLAIKLMGFIYRVILTNIKGFEDIGNSYYGTGYKVYIFILALATAGIPGAISKLVSEKLAVGDAKGAHKIFKTAFKLFSIVGLVFALILFFGSKFIATSMLSNPGVQGTIASLAPAVFFVSLASVFRGYFIGMENVSAHSVAQVIEQIVNSVLSVVFVLMLIGNSPEIMAMGSTAATAVSSFVALAYLYIYYTKNKKQIYASIREATPHIIESSKVTLKKIMKYVIPISFASIVVSLSGMVDVLSVVDGLVKHGYDLTKANEYYGIIVGKVDILVSIPHTFNVAITTPLIPIITGHIVKKEMLAAKNKINFSMKLSSIVAFPCVVGLFILAAPLFQTIYPNASAGAYLLQIEVWAIIFSLLAQTAQGSLNGIGKLFVPGISVLIAAVVKYILNVTLIPVFGEVMVPITTIVYHLVNCIIVVSVLYVNLKCKPDTKNIIWKPLGATLIMAIFVLLSNYIVSLVSSSNVLNMFVCIVVGSLTYFISLIKLKTFTEDEEASMPYLIKPFKKFS